MKTWDELTERYIAHLTELRRSRTTINATQRYLEKLREYVRQFGAARPADVTCEHVEAFSQRLRFEPGEHGQLYSPSTVQNTLQMLRLFFRWAVRERLLLNDAFRDVRLQRVKHFERRRWLSVEEVNRLLVAPPNFTLPGLRDRAIMEALYGAGLRREECSMLDVRDVDFEQGALHVRFGKGGEPRLQPMGETLQQALRTYLERCRPTLMRRKKDDGALFVQVTGARVPPHGIGNLVRQHAERAGLGRVTAHQLRHAFATHLLQNGANLVAVQRLLGHARLQSTSVYTDVTPQQVIDDHRKTHPRARRKRVRKPSPPSS